MSAKQVAGKFLDRLKNLGSKAADKVKSSSLGEGFQAAARQMEQAGDYSHTVFPFGSSAKNFYADLASQGITPTQAPGKFTGAVGARLLTDLGTDSTRQFYWKHNHPAAITDALSEQFLGANQERLKQAIPNPVARAATTLGAIGAPMALTSGAIDITNPGELFRPKGFAQQYPEVGSDDRRETAQGGQELFDRLLLQRQGKPLKYETAKRDIPDLTPERYGNYMRYKYQDRGLLNQGMFKGTMENLRGVPEAQVFGFPISAPSVGASVGGIAGLNRGLANASTGAGVAGRGLAGMAIGLATGKLFNAAVAQANRPDPATTAEYAYDQGRRHLPTQGI